MDPQFLQILAINAIPFIFAIAFHEAAHGYIAEKLGDPTARMMGRITLNPIVHIDPVGTVILPVLLIWSNAGVLFGWARPVPVNFANLRRPRLDSLLVAFAGPGSNFIQFSLWAFLILAIRFTVGLPLEGGAGEGSVAAWLTIPLVLIAKAGLKWNFVLGVINLIPILPLDGGRMLHSLLPVKLAQAYSRMERFGFFILIFILFAFGHHLAFLGVALQAATNFLAPS